MLPFLPSLVVAQVVTAPLSPLERQFVTQPQEVRTLPGQLNEVPVFNSNSPEVVQRDGILLSSFPPNGKYAPNAHLNHPLKGRFDVFTHHIARPLGEPRTLYQGLLVNNPTNKTAIVEVLQAASYVTASDAPFKDDIASKVEDPRGEIFSGPGSRLMGDILRGVTHANFPRRIVIPPYQSRMVFSLAIAPSSARSTFMRLQSNGPVYLANLAMYAIPEFPKLPGADPTQSSPPAKPTFREPTLGEWRGLVTVGRLVEPRDLVPTPLEQINPENKIFGRVAGISVGSEWAAKLTDGQEVPYLSIPERGQAFSYPLSSLNTGTHGTQQVQSAPMLVRYPDTAYLAHGNYGVHYNLTVPLRNNTKEKQTVALTLQTPLKQDQHSDRLFFVSPPQGPIFFRGTLKISYNDDGGARRVRYFHLIQRRGQPGDPLVTLNLLPGEQRDVEVEFIYPPDATPPQVLTVQTQELFYGRLR